MTCSSLNQRSNRYRVPTVSLSAYHRRKRGLLKFTCIAVAAWMLAGCHTTTDKSNEKNSDLSETTVSSSVITHPPISSQSPVQQRSSKKNDGEVPLWERPEILAKYPVKAKKNPDGSYDYSDPRFENADLCEDVPRGYWESKGYTVIGSDYIKLANLKDCAFLDEKRDLSKYLSISTDKRKYEDIAGRIYKKYNPGRFDQIIFSIRTPGCVAYVETSIGRIGFGYLDDEEKMSEEQLCQKANDNLKKVS